MVVSALRKALWLWMSYDYEDIMVVRALRKQAQQGIRQLNLPDKWALKVIAH
jgi:hypothetical protein